MEERQCVYCGRPIEPGRRSDTLVCDMACWNALSTQRKREAKHALERFCLVCGDRIPSSRRSDAKYCSERCAQDKRGHVNNAQRRIRVDSDLGSFSRWEIYERDKWVCQLCGETVDSELSYPDPKCASLDHVLPLSRGGSHHPENLQLAHLRCNYAAGDRKTDIQPRPALLREGAEFYRLSEAAEMIGTTKNILNTAMKRGRVPFVLTPGGRRLLSAEVVADLAVTGVPQRPVIERPTSRALTCRWCGDEISVAIGLTSKRRYCSDACVRASKNVRRRVGRTVVTTPCAVCGVEVTHEINGPKNRLCSKECVDLRRNERLREKRAAAYVAKPCSVCGELIPFDAGHRGHPPATCSPECAKRWPALRTQRAQRRKKAAGK